MKTLLSKYLFYLTYIVMVFSIYQVLTREASLAKHVIPDDNDPDRFWGC